MNKNYLTFYGTNNVPDFYKNTNELLQIFADNQKDKYGEIFACNAANEIINQQNRLTEIIKNLTEENKILKEKLQKFNHTTGKKSMLNDEQIKTLKNAGNSNRKIAEILGISEATVRNHLNKGVKNGQTSNHRKD